MVDNFDMGESKYGRIYKVAGPRKCPARPLTRLLFCLQSSSRRT